jgi:putative SOS response-associated peptidase YedK
MSGCAIVTTAAQPEIAHIHHRQPLLLTAQAAAGWLDGAPASDCVSHYPVAVHKVSSSVNDARLDSSDLTLPIKIETSDDVQGSLF